MQDIECTCPSRNQGQEGSQGGGGGDDPGSDGTRFDIPRLHAVDPNEITGPIGYEAPRWVARKDRLGYTILFENDPDFATAPAQIVRVNLPVHPHLNINTVRLGTFGFGAFVFDVPPNTSFYSKRLDVRDSLQVYVDVTAGIDVVKKEVFWIFESIDPLTGLPPEAGDVGFLPVNDTTVNIYNDTLPKRGEGYVTFTIVPANSTVTGDTAFAQASIVFDINEAILTNTWTNLIDAFPPTSTLDTLPATVPSDSILVITWTGQDDPGGVGVRDYDLYASRDAGPFLLVAEKIDTTRYVFTGVPGATYSFYTRATDHVGNTEEPKFAGEQTVFFESSLSGLQVSARVLLQGPYVSAAQLMHDSLRVQNRIPLTEPYTGLNTFTHTGGGGGEQTLPSVLAVTGPNAIVDWVFLELRSATSAAEVVATRAALLQRDGDVVDVDGVSPVAFAPSVNAANYYLTVRHRNHLGVQLGAGKFYARGSVVATDFTILPPEGFYSHNGLSPAQRLISGKYALWAGNGRIDLQIKYNGSNNDRTAILAVVGLTTPNAVVPGYLPADYNMDGVVKYNGSANDRNVLLGNVGILTPSAVVEGQVAR
ncbi:MAG: hypothetical protein IPM98_06160 [Lewinellaceae bacterium]|nr:hypothetical protein [Lewinellaceae bacterium]